MSDGLHDADPVQKLVSPQVLADERVAQAIQAKILNIYPENRESDEAALVIAQAAIAALDIPALEQAAYERGFAAGQASIDSALDAAGAFAAISSMRFNTVNKDIESVDVDISVWDSERYERVYTSGTGPTRASAILDACRKAGGGERCQLTNHHS